MDVKSRAIPTLQWPNSGPVPEWLVTEVAGLLENLDRGAFIQLAGMLYKAASKKTNLQQKVRFWKAFGLSDDETLAMINDEAYIDDTGHFRLYPEEGE